MKSPTGLSTCCPMVDVRRGKACCRDEKPRGRMSVEGAWVDSSSRTLPLDRRPCERGDPYSAGGMMRRCKLQTLLFVSIRYPTSPGVRWLCFRVRGADEEFASRE